MHVTRRERERAQLAGMGAAVLGLHVLGWGLLAAHASGASPAYCGAGALAYGLGLRHAFDADHIGAIDDSTRLLVQQGRRPLATGFFFSLGHSSVVLAFCLAVACGASAMQGPLGALRNLGGLVGGGVCAVLLALLGAANLVVFAGLWRLWRARRERVAAGRELDSLLARRGFMSRLFGTRLWKLISASWHLYPVGFLFGLGFDTASEIALIALTPAVSPGHASGAFGAVLALPLLFAAGMSLMDTADGVLMSNAYRWAVHHPMRRLQFNLATTGLSAAVALLVAAIEALQLLGGHTRALRWLAQLDFPTLGTGIVASFLLLWIAAVVSARLRPRSPRASASGPSRGFGRASRSAGAPRRTAGRESARRRSGCGE